MTEIKRKRKQYPMNGRKNEHLRPIENLAQVVKNKTIRQQVGWVNGQHYLNGEFITAEKLDKLYPVEITYRSIQVDKRQVKH